MYIIRIREKQKPTLKQRIKKVIKKGLRKSRKFRIRLKNFLLKTITLVAFASLWIGSLAVENNPNEGMLMFFISLAWLTLFCIANKENLDNGLIW